MDYKKITLPDFFVIGKEGTTDDGPDFISQLWDTANSSFSEIAHLALISQKGTPRVWGLMSDMAKTFAPWENSFTRGRYLAGVEVAADALPPSGWVKWHSPAYEYIVAPSDSPDAFQRAIDYLCKSGFALAGAAYDMTIPGEGSYIYLPIRKL